MPNIAPAAWDRDRKVSHCHLEKVLGEHKFTGQPWNKGGNDPFSLGGEGEGIPGKEEWV